MGGMLLLILGIFFFTRNLFRFEKVSRFEAVILPVYSLIMAWLALDQHHPSVMAIVVTAIFGVLMAWLQSWGARVKVTGEQDKHDRPVVEVRRGWWYLIGWLLILCTGLCLPSCWVNMSMCWKKQAMRLPRISSASAISPPLPVGISTCSRGLRVWCIRCCLCARSLR